MDLEVRWLGRMEYDEALQRQHELAHARAEDQAPDQLLLLEHPPVLTLGRQADPAHIRTAPEELARLGITVHRVERGGEVTFHGPGQLVAYPIIGLAARGILLRPFVRALEAAMRDTCAAFGVAADRRDGLPGCWVDPTGPRPRKIGALGIRVERGVTYHGSALNVTTDLAGFALIDPCGLPDVEVTSIARELGWTPAEAASLPLERAADVFASAFRDALEAASPARRPLAAAAGG